MQDTLTMPLGITDLIPADDFIGLASSPESLSTESYTFDLKGYIEEILDSDDLFPEIDSLDFKAEASELSSSSSSVISSGTSSSSSGGSLFGDLGFMDETPIWSNDFSGHQSPWRDRTDYSNVVISDVFLLNGTQMKSDPEPSATNTFANINKWPTFDDMNSLVDPSSVFGEALLVKPELIQPAPPLKQENQSQVEQPQQPRSILGSSQSMSPPMSDDEDRIPIFDDPELDDVKIDQDVLNTLYQVIDNTKLENLDTLEEDLCNYLTEGNDLIDDDDVFLEDEEEDDEFLEEEEEEDDDEDEETEIQAVTAPPVQASARPQVATRARIPATVTTQTQMIRRRVIKQEPVTRSDHADQLWRSVRHHAALDHTYHKDINSECFMARYGLETPSDSGSDEEIDVITVDTKETNERGTLPTNPTFYDRNNIQRRITTAIRTGTGTVDAPSSAVVATTTPTVAGRGRRPGPIGPPGPSNAPGPMPPITIPTQRMVAICPAVPIPVPAKQPRKYTRRRKAADDEEDYVETPRAPKKPRQTKAKGAPARRRARNSDNVKPDEKREMHNNLERGRRILMKDRFNNLRRVVPQVSKRERAPKVTILQQAKLYCAHLRETQAELSMEAEELRRRREFLTQTLKMKRSELYQYCNYLCGGDETLLRQTYEMLRIAEGAEDGESSWWTENGAGTEHSSNYNDN